MNAAKSATIVIQPFSRRVRDRISGTFRIV